MPQIPEGVHRPRGDQLVIDLLEAIALEEMANAHLLNAQGEKVQAIVRQYAQCGLDYGHMEESCLATQSVLQNLIMSQWLLTNKLQMVAGLKYLCHVETDDNKTCAHPCCDGTGQYGCYEKSRP